MGSRVWAWVSGIFVRDPLYFGGMGFLASQQKEQYKTYFSFRYQGLRFPDEGYRVPRLMVLDQRHITVVEVTSDRPHPNLAFYFKSYLGFCSTGSLLFCVPVTKSCAKTTVRGRGGLLGGRI